MNFFFKLKILFSFIYSFFQHIDLTYNFLYLYLFCHSFILFKLHASHLCLYIQLFPLAELFFYLHISHMSLHAIIVLEVCQSKGLLWVNYKIFNSHFKSICTFVFPLNFSFLLLRTFLYFLLELEIFSYYKQIKIF